MIKHHLTQSEYHHYLSTIIRQMKGWVPDKVIGISRGGTVPATYLSHWFDVPMYTYHLSTRDHKRVDTFDKSLINAVEGNKILIVDDICDSGETFNTISEMLENHNCSPKWACLHFNISQKVFVPDYYGAEIDKVEDDKWVVYPWEQWW